MAITKITYLSDKTASYRGRRLKEAIAYILNPDKTQGGRLVGSENCIASRAYETMKETKRLFNKTDKRQGYHIVISFNGKEASPDTAFAIAARFTEEYLSEYEAVYVVHDNTDNIHAHVIFNSVRWTDGGKYRYELGDWAGHIQPLTNRLCEEHGLSTIDISQSKGQCRDPEAIRYERSEDSKRFGGDAVKWSEMIRNDIDACIALSHSYERFIEMLREKGYTVKNADGEGKYLAVKPPGRQRYRRLATLGDSYTEERIRERIATETLGTASFSYQSEHDPLPAPQTESEAKDKKAEIIGGNMKRPPRAKLSKIQKKYYAKLYRIGQLKKGSYSQAWKYREDIYKMKKLERQYLFLVKYDIKSEADLNERVAALAEKKEEASAEKGRAYKAESKHRAVFDTAHAMAKLETARKEYEKGDDIFREEYEEWGELNKSLAAEGYTLPEALELEKQCKAQKSQTCSAERKLYLELKTGREIESELASEKSGSNSGRGNNGIAEKNKTPETKQPKR